MYTIFDTDLFFRETYHDGEVMKAMGAFGGGNGEVCGAIAGALAVMGLRFSRATEDEREDPKMWSYTHEVLERF